MIGLPNDGDEVKVWPMPGRRVQANERPIDALGGGRFLAPGGETVVWSPFYLHLLRAGDILLHEVPEEKVEAADVAKRPRYDHAKAAKHALEQLEKAEAKPGDKQEVGTKVSIDTPEVAAGIAEQEKAIEETKRTAKAKKE